MNKIRIALIDTGISNEYCKKRKLRMHHFHVKNNELVEEYKEPSDNHAQLCTDMILRDDNPNLEILDICVMDKFEKISYNDLILGIKKAISQRADIINLSLGYSTYSQELFDVCKEAVSNNIAVIAAASHEGEVFYPADFKNVVCVKPAKNQRKIFQTVDGSTISISDKVSMPFANIDFFSSSFAAAYFSGELGRLLGYYPFFDKFVLLKNNFNLNLIKHQSTMQKVNYDKCKIYKTLETSKAALVFDPCEDPKTFYKELLPSNIVAYYDYQKNDFQSFPNIGNAHFDTIFIINTLSYGKEMAISSDIETRFPWCKIFYLGKFKEIPVESNLIYCHEMWNSINLVSLKKPIIIVTGIGSNFNKFDVTVKLFKDFEKNGIKAKVATYNKKGVIYGFDVFEYPEKIIFPDIVGSINNYMNFIETNNDLDIWLINSAGGSSFIDNKNRNNFGKLNEAYFHATNVDLLIFCIDGFVDKKDLSKWTKKLNAFGVTNILFILSENTVDPTSWDSKEKLQTYKLDAQKYRACFSSLKKDLDKNLFSMKDVNNGALYNAIIDIFCK